MRGRVRKKVVLRFLRIEPRVVPKVSLTGSATERIDTRVLFVVYQVEGDFSGMYSGQKLDVFIEKAAQSQTTGVAMTPVRLVSHSPAKLGDARPINVGTGTIESPASACGRGVYGD